jgi:hypothetical protein
VKTKERKNNGECCLCVGFFNIYNGMEKMATCLYLVLVFLLLYMLFELRRKAISVYTTRLSLCCRFNRIL